MLCQTDPLVDTVCELYHKISNLETLKPSKDVDTLFTHLVRTCIPPSPIDVTKLCKRVQDIRSHLITLCGQAEGLLEKHYSTILGSFENPLQNLEIFPYFNNYLKLSLLEYDILSRHYRPSDDEGHASNPNTNPNPNPTRVAFIGSGPLPLTSIVLASHHLTGATFHNYDIDVEANTMAWRLVESDPDLSKRMVFHTSDIMDVTSDLEEYDVVFLAALVGMDKEEKVRVIEHLAKHMAPGALLMLRSAHGARAFLYPVVDPVDLQGFEVLTVYHPTDEVINSVVVARKLPVGCHKHELKVGSMVLPSKCSCAEIQAFNPLTQMNMIEELAFEERRA